MSARYIVLISALPPLLASAFVAIFAEAPLRCSLYPTALICISCFWGGYLSCLFGDQASVEKSGSTTRLIFQVGLFALGFAPMFWGLSYLGWNVGSVIAGAFDVLPIDRRCPVEVDPYWLGEAIKQLPPDFMP
jgi:hypothetical protein